MAIKPLPEATICLLGSTQGLTSPLSLVKELIDNSLDANATSIDILISSNTLDKVEVRDNGLGIPREDLEALGRRGYTSKLSSFEELKSIGGISLGFRGEALFSATQLGQVSVTTKTEGELVATAATLKVRGGVEYHTRCSHPVGTTVSVTNFLHSIPVRKQTYLKEAPKTLTKIQELLRSYSLARPRIKFSLKVIKGAKGSWSFSPRINYGIKEVVSQVLGRELATCCMENSVTFEDSGYMGSDVGNKFCEDITDNRKFVVNMFSPKRDADFSKVSGGQYISVDARPVSHEKGTMKKIVSMFRRFIRHYLAESSDKVRNPFLRLNIECPVGSYDVNIEPAKDDVIFVNEDAVLNAIEGAFKNIYGNHVSPEAHSTDVVEGKEDQFELLLSRKSLFVSPVQSSSLEMNSDDLGDAVCVRGSETEGEGLRLVKRQTCGVDTSQDYIEEIETSARRKQTRNSVHGEDLDLIDIFSQGSSLDPWLVAKMKVGRDSQIPKSVLHTPGAGSLPTPQQSSDSIVFELKVPEVEGRTAASCQCSRAKDNVLPTRTSREAQHSHESWPIVNRRAHTLDKFNEDALLPEENTPAIHRHDGFISARTINEAQLPSTIQGQERKRPKTFNKPFKPPSRLDDVKSRDSLRQTKLTGSMPSHRFNCTENQDMLEQEQSNLELAWAMDYEHRRSEATKRRREELHTGSLEAGYQLSLPEPMRRSYPHKNLYNAALTAISKPPADPSSKDKMVEVIKTSIPDGDPRGYFMRRQKSYLSQVGKPDGPRLSRAKSRRLPLEWIPENQELHEHMFRLITDLVTMKRLAKALAKDDAYIQRGSATRALARTMATREAEHRENKDRVTDLLEKWKNKAIHEGHEADYKLLNT